MFEICASWEYAKDEMSFVLCVIFRENCAMRKTKRKGNFLFCLLLNILLNPEGFIPAVIFLVLHFILGWSIWFAVAAMGIWLIWIIVRMCVIGWAVRCSNIPDPPKENKNPYSAGRNQKNQEFSD